MNIFILDQDITLNAQYHNDTHLNKMLLEMTQMLCTVHYKLGAAGAPYRKTHANHPCTQWLAESYYNYIYGIELAYELEEERIYRGFKPSKCMQVIGWCNQHIPVNIPMIDKTDFRLAISNTKYHLADPVDAYRAYHIGEKQGMWVKQRQQYQNVKSVKKWYPYRWTKRGKPDWFTIENKPKYRVQHADNTVSYVNDLTNLIKA
jgi:hypothetical protein